MKQANIFVAMKNLICEYDLIVQSEKSRAKCLALRDSIECAKAISFAYTRVLPSPCSTKRTAINKVVRVCLSVRSA